MREIKFKGKSKVMKLWVCGDLITSKPNKIDGGYTSWIIEKAIMPFGAVSTPTEKFICVDNESVGQYAEITDQCGREVYEGDKVSFSPYIERTGTVIFRDGIWLVEHDMKTATYYLHKVKNLKLI